MCIYIYIYTYIYIYIFMYYLLPSVYLHITPQDSFQGANRSPCVVAQLPDAIYCTST